MNDITILLAEIQFGLSQLSAEKTSSISIPLSDIPEQATDSQTLITLLSNVVTEGDLHRSDLWASHMTPSISSASIIGQLIAGLHNGNLLSPQLYPMLADIEQRVIKWLCTLFQQPHGHFITGSSYANLEALWQAKQQASSSRIVYTSKASHYSIAKACQILDLELRTITTNDKDQLLTEALQNACQQQAPLAIVATLGTSSAGAIDPLHDCIHLAQQFNAWCHIDAAWGGSLSLLPEFKTLFTTDSQADSICFDPHKGWQQPKPASVLLYQQPLTPMLFEQPNYLEQAPFNSLPGSRGGELFLPLWLSLMSAGVETLRQQLRSRLQQADDFALQLSQRTAWQIYHSPTGIVCFLPNDATDLTDLIHQGIFSKARINEKDVYRAVFTSPNTKASSLITVLEPYF